MKNTLILVNYKLEAAPGLYQSESTIAYSYDELMEICESNEETGFKIISDVIPLVISGRTYSERKASLESLAIRISNSEVVDFYYSEEADIFDFFYTNGKRYGLLTDFRENAII